MAATKTANVTARIQPDIRESAEVILEIPQKIKTRDNINEAEFGNMITIGLAQAKAEESLTVADAFTNLRMELAK